MPELIKGIQTKNGVAVFDYNSLGNLPVSDASLSQNGGFADAAVTGIKIISLEKKVNEIPTSVDQAVKDINQEKDNAVTSVNIAKNNSISSMEEKTASAIKIIADEGNKQITVINANAENIKKIKGVEITPETPTGEKTAVWINDNSKENFNIPEIRDDSTSSYDTWSSQKINTEVEKAKENSLADKKVISEMKESIDKSYKAISSIKESVENTNVSVQDTYNNLLTKSSEAISNIDVAKTSAINSVSSTRDSAISNLDTTKNNNIKEIEDEGTKQKNNVIAAAAEIIKINGVEVSSNQPTNEKTAVWINNALKESVKIPEIKDDVVNATDTWSSEKIASEINILKSILEALQSKI